MTTIQFNIMANTANFFSTLIPRDFTRSFSYFNYFSSLVSPLQSLGRQWSEKYCAETLIEVAVARREVCPVL